MKQARFSPVASGLKNAFTLIELLVVIGLITVLIGLLFPALHVAIRQAHYVRWQGYAHGLQADPNLAAQWTLQNDLGGSTISNQSLAFHDLRLTGNMLDGTAMDWLTGPPLSASRLQTLWGQPGRWPGKPALTFTAANVIGFPDTQNRLARALSVSGAVTFVMWVKYGYQGPVLGWQTAGPLNVGGNTYRAYLCWVDGTNGLYWMQGHGGTPDIYHLVGSNLTVPPSDWQCWVFTKTNGAKMRCYLNGVDQFPAGLSVTMPIPPASVVDSTSLWITRNSLSLGVVQGTYAAGTVDEVAIFDRELDPSEIRAMYDMGTP